MKIQCCIYFPKQTEFSAFGDVVFLNETRGSPSIQMNTPRDNSVILKQRLVCIQSRVMGRSSQGDVKRNGRRCGHNVNLQVAVMTWYRQKHHLTVQSCQGTKDDASPALRSPIRRKGDRRKRRADALLCAATRGIWLLYACSSELFLLDTRQKSWAVSPTVHLSSSLKILESVQRIQSAHILSGWAEYNNIMFAQYITFSFTFWNMFWKNKEVCFTKKCIFANKYT